MSLANHIATLSPHWRKFGTLTFENSLVLPGFRSWIENSTSTTIRQDGFKMWFAFISDAAKAERRHFSRLLWVVREERGEGGRYHLHCLCNSGLLPGAIGKLWKFGRAEFSDYKPETSRAEQYICKCLGVDYEVGRFEDSAFCGVTCSASVERVSASLSRQRLADLRSMASAPRQQTEMSLPGETREHLLA